MKLSKLITVINLISFSSLAQADQIEKPGYNLREACREKIAWHYIKVYTDLQYASRYKKHLSSKESESEKSLRATNSEISKITDEIDRKDYDATLFQKRDNLNSKKNLLEKQLKEIPMLLKENDQKIDNLTSTRNRLDTKLKDIFDISINKKSQFPNKITYKSPCPKYRAQCPLPKNQAEQLKNILGENTPLDCKRYSNIR